MWQTSDQSGAGHEKRARLAAGSIDGPAARTIGASIKQNIRVSVENLFLELAPSSQRTA
jgi:hypothetical protein